MATTVSHAKASSVPRRPPPVGVRNSRAWLVRNLFGSVGNTLLTAGALWLLFVTLPGLVRWAVLDAVWYTPDAGVCHAAMGACWAVVPEKYRVMLFGTFPYSEHWRGALVIAIVIALAAVSTIRRFWSYGLFAAWVVAMLVVFTLLLGGVLGLRPIGTHEWGGLPLTLVMFVGTVVGGLPAGVLLALGRRSTMPVIRALCTGFIEIVRGLPLVTVLFMASLMFPLFMPEGISIDKFARAQIAMAAFFAAYAAEVIRGGLQAIPRGQYEAADTIGLGYWQKTTRVVLPQVMRIVLPSMMNEIIRAFKNTTFIGIIGLFDVLRATSTAIQDPVWVRYSIESYLFISALYFVLCFAMSQYGQRVERDLARN
ncbi:amino acid ABC transporter permease [Terrihabitans rhizophilus]|uniref:Amino acid ABC transporter permease n=1 Tax=Terrihabitans rhizophilus TaxID=3092662 RepID=A0ABU4RIQ4_9HYPH|nr:amino acid ABC transporter permease [Terrihabitans sp. PJ23]MDX6804719.1 amino acid ABC transporter permease [Terrihabitans sp. PJ23]